MSLVGASDADSSCQLGRAPLYVTSRWFAPMQPNKFFVLFLSGEGGRTGNRRFWASSRPNLAPGGLGKAPAGAPLCIYFQPGRPTLLRFREVMLNPRVTALEFRFIRTSD